MFVKKKHCSFREADFRAVTASIQGHMVGEDNTLRNPLLSTVNFTKIFSFVGHIGNFNPQTIQVLKYINSLLRF